jgi:hypothetical protein
LLRATSAPTRAAVSVAAAPLVSVRATGQARPGGARPGLVFRVSGGWSACRGCRDGHTLDRGPVLVRLSVAAFSVSSAARGWPGPGAAIDRCLQFTVGKIVVVDCEVLVGRDHGDHLADRISVGSYRLAAQHYPVDQCTGVSAQGVDGHAGIARACCFGVGVVKTPHGDVGCDDIRVRIVGVDQYQAAFLAAGGPGSAMPVVLFEVPTTKRLCVEAGLPLQIVGPKGGR